MSAHIPLNAPPPGVDWASWRAARERPQGWTPPGPQPLGDAGRPELQPQADEDLSFLSGNFRIFQKKKGHRFSIDDFMVADEALCAMTAQPERPLRALDLGCGIGSVLMMVAWGLPETSSLVGVEAQDLSFGMVRRSLAYNGLESRVTVHHADFRSPGLALGGPFDLITGTPPYFPEGSGPQSEVVQRGPCLFEHRGGVEAYLERAAIELHPQGVLVLAVGATGLERMNAAAAPLGLAPRRIVSVVPRERKPVLFHVVTLGACTSASPPAEKLEFLARRADGSLPQAMHEARRRLGFPPKRGQEPAAG